MATFQVTGVVTFKDGRVGTVFDFHDISASSMDDAAEKAKRRAASDLGVDDALIEIKTVSIPERRDTPREDEHLEAVFEERTEMQEGGVVSGDDPGFIVIENTPGYMPDSEPADFTEYSDAVAYANELADQLEEEGYETDRSIASRDNYYAISATRLDKPHDLGRSIEVISAEPMQRGGVVGVSAIIGEAGPEAVIPLDDPEAIEVMAEAIEEGGANGGETEAAAEAVESAAEATEAAAEAVAVVATADALSNVAEAEADAVEAVAEAEADVAHEETEAVEAEADTVEELAEEESVEAASLDTSPEESHWFFRRLAHR